MIQRTEYEVQAGDTLARIAEIYGVSISNIIAANHLEGRQFRVGQVLLIPWD